MSRGIQNSVFEVRHGAPRAGPNTLKSAMLQIAGGRGRILRAGALLATAIAVSFCGEGAANAQALGSFAILAGSTVTNTGDTTINGNIGVSPGTAITGFPPGVVLAPYAIHQNDAVASQAQSDLTTAYNVLAGRPTTVDLTGQDLAGKTLDAGVYNFNTSAQLTGTVTLDAHGDSSAVFIFNIGSTLTTGSGSSVNLINGAQAGNVFFRVGSSATLGADTTFEGKIFALTSITLVTGSTINCGAALARNGAVTLDTNTIGICPLAVAAISDGLDTTATTTETIVSSTIDNAAAANNTLPLGFQVLALLTPTELATALTEISGEAAAGVAPTGTQAMDSFLTLLLDDHHGGGGVVSRDTQGAPAPQDNGPASHTVSVMGYAEPKPPAGGAAFASFDRPAMPDINHWTIWTAAYGGYGQTQGDAIAGTHDSFSHAAGVAIGADYQFSTDTKLGFAVGGGGTGFGLADNLGGGKSTMVQAAVYGRKSFDNAYLAGVVAYGVHDVTTSREVTFAGIDTLTAEFAAQNVAGQIEAGYRIGMITPYAALRGQAFATPAYNEAAQSGNSTFALGYEAHTTTTARTEIGARLDWTTPLDNGGLAFQAAAAWAHEYWSDASINAAFLSIPGATFAVDGATSAPDSLLLSTGTQINFDNGFAIAGSLNGKFAQNAQTYAGSLKVSRSW